MTQGIGPKVDASGPTLENLCCKAGKLIEIDDEKLEFRSL